MMAGYERVVTESPDRESASRADEYTRNFLQDEALPTIWQELAFHRRFVPGITLAEINALTGDWFPDQNRIVVVSAPDATGVVLPDRGAARGRRQDRRGEEARGLRGRRGGAGADDGAAGARDDRQDHAPCRRHHRVDAVERRDRRAQADDAERGSDSLPRHRARRDLARDRRGFRVRPHCRQRPLGRRRRAVQLGHARQAPRRQGRRRLTVHRRDRAGPGRREHAAGPGNDVPVDLPALHAAAGRSRPRSPRSRRRRGACSRTGPRARTWCSTRPSTRRSAATVRAGSPRPRPRSISGTSPSR